MEIRVLGPVEAAEGGRSILPTAAKPRQLLALLALHVGSVVPTSTLVEELWGDRPPRSALTTLQTYVLALRRGLAAAHPGDAARGRALLVTRLGGYLLDLDPDAVDAHRFRALVAEGRTALERDDRAASHALDAALALWRGPALAGFEAGLPLSIERIQLEECRLGAIEARIDADMRLGRHGSLLGELSALCVRHPMHEGLRARHMLALLRAGRRGEALDVFAAVRRTLVDELGIEPSRRLQELQRLVLDAGPGDARAVADVGLDPAPSVRRAAGLSVEPAGRP